MQRKNWDPFVLGPAFAMDKTPGPVCLEKNELNAHYEKIFFKNVMHSPSTGNKMFCASPKSYIHFSRVFLLRQLWMVNYDVK